MPSCGGPVQLACVDELEDRLGDEVVERTAVADAGAQIGARHLEAGHLDVQPVDAPPAGRPVRPGRSTTTSVTEPTTSS